MTRKPGRAITPNEAAGAAGIAIALILSTISPGALKADPKALTASQMDSVTAGGIRVDAIAYAQASGHEAVAHSRSYALAGTTVDQLEIGVGFAEALAFACCNSRSRVAVHSSASSTGDVIVHRETYAFTFKGAIATADSRPGYFAYGYAAAFLVAMSFEDRLAPHKDAIGELGRRWALPSNPVIGVKQDRPRDGVVTGFEFGPLFVAGLRWRVFENYLASTPTSSMNAAARLRPSRAPFARAERTTFGLRP